MTNPLEAHELCNLEPLFPIPSELQKGRKGATTNKHFPNIDWPRGGQFT